MNQIGSRVRRVHPVDGVTGTIVRHAEPSRHDGTSRVVVRWDMPDGTCRESSVSPDLLAPPETPVELDPPVVLFVTTPGKKFWLLRGGRVVETSPDTTAAAMELVAAFQDAIFPASPDAKHE